jgi:hypothetical protein
MSAMEEYLESQAEKSRLTEEQKRSYEESEAAWRAAPFSESLGLPTLWHRPPKARLISTGSINTSFGFKTISHNATPLSSMFGLPVLKKAKQGKNTSFGFPLLTKGKANKTHSFGLPLLTKSK